MHLISPATGLLVRQLYQICSKENAKALRYCPFYKWLLICPNTRIKRKMSPSCDLISGRCITNVWRGLHIFSRNLCIAEIELLMRIFKLKLCTCVQSMHIFARLFWRARKTLVKQPRCMSFFCVAHHIIFSRKLLMANISTNVFVLNVEARYNQPMHLPVIALLPGIMKRNNQKNLPIGPHCFKIQFVTSHRACFISMVFLH